MKRVIVVTMFITLLGSAQTIDEPIISDTSIQKKRNVILEESQKNIEKSFIISIQANKKMEKIKQNYEDKIADLEKKLLNDTVQTAPILIDTLKLDTLKVQPVQPKKKSWLKRLFNKQ